MEAQFLATPSISIFPAILDSQNLLSAWEKVEENAGGPGVDGVSIEVFDLILDRELTQLQGELRDHLYRPSPLLRVSIAKPQGGMRTLAIPTVRDRLAQTAAAQILTPILDAEFEEVSFGYRRGRSVEQALAKVRQYRDEGYQWVVDADLNAFFDNVDWGLLLDRLRQSITDSDVLQLIELWVRTKIRDGVQTIVPTKGLPQGSPISPVLANLYLDRFDEAMLRHGYKFVRFADDFVILCKEKPEAEQALQLTESLLGKLRLALKPEKTRLTHFDEGFRYLGTLFIRTLDMPAPRPQGTPLVFSDTAQGNTKTTLAQTLNLALQQVGKARQDFPEQPAPVEEQRQLAPPPQEETPPSLAPPDTTTTAPQPEAPSSDDTTEQPTDSPRRASIPFRRTLYIQEQGSILAREDERLIVKKEGNTLLEVPAAKIDQIFIFGNCTVTTPAMTYCLKEEIPIILLSSRGNYYGIIDSPLSENVSLHRQQFTRAADAEFSLQTAKVVVTAKLHNCRLLLQRHQRRKHIPLVATVIDHLGELSVRLQHAATREEVNGYEGAGAAQYFAALGQLVDPAFRFTNRTRQPPTDPVNSLLSFGYTLLFYNLYGLIVARGLHPYVGHLHLMRDRHPSLASDLIEEFRAPIVDSLVLTLINTKTLTPTDFTRLVDGPCLLKDTARKTFIRAFEQKMATQITHPHTGLVVDYRRCLDLQVCHMLDWIRGDAEEYKAMRMR